MLRRAFGLVGFVCCLTVGCTSGAPDERPISFEAYPARIAHEGPGAPIDWESDSTARRFSAPLEGGRVEGANFAGHLNIVTWGCGTQCRTYLILDLRSGRVVSDTLLDFSCHVPEFRRESELIVQRADTASLGPCGRGVTRYFRWSGERLEEIHPRTT